MLVSVQSSEFQIFTPLIDKLNDLPFVLWGFCANLFLCLVAYMHSRNWKYFWLLEGRFKLKALCMTREVLNSTRSVNLRRFNFLNKGVEGVYLPVRHTSLIAFFWVVIILDRLLMYVLPQISEQ